LIFISTAAGNLKHTLFETRATKNEKAEKTIMCTHLVHLFWKLKRKVVAKIACF